MFSQGQLVFAILFAVSFIIIIFFSYRKDRSIHLKQYRGSLWVLLGFIIFMAILLFVKYLLTR